MESKITNRVYEKVEEIPPQIFHKAKDNPEAKVTTVTIVVARPITARRCLESLKLHVDFPSNNLVLISPEHIDLIEWCVSNNFTVYLGRIIPIIKAKHFVMSQVLTEFAYLMDCDWEAHTSFGGLLNQMEKDPQLGVIAPKMFRTPTRQLLGSFIRDEGDFWKRLKIQPTMVTDPNKSIYYVDYTTLSSLLIRMSMYEEYPFDPNYGMGFAHEDWFLQLLRTEWKKAVYKYSVCSSNEFNKESPGWYRNLRHRPDLVAKSELYFQEKWGKPLISTWME